MFVKPHWNIDDDVELSFLQKLFIFLSHKESISYGSLLVLVDIRYEMFLSWLIVVLLVCV